jgi:uncharacterized membrane protein
MDETPNLLPSFLTPLDAAALGLFLAAWAGVGWLVERPHAAHPSTQVIVERYRLRWMETMLVRDPRIMDAQLLNNLRSGAAFFASGAMIAIGGVAAVLGQPDRIIGLARDLTGGFDMTRTAWEAKLLALALMLVAAFMKFVWSHRLFGYCAVLMGALGEDPEDPENRAIARKAGLINVTAARSFNRGLRALYFALALLAWLLGPWALIAATLATAATLWRREFRSASRRAMLEE